MAESARSQRASAELRAAILELIGRSIYPLLVTSTSRGAPYSRPVICVNRGFDVWMVTRAHSKKMSHLRANARAGLIWTDPPRSILLQGAVDWSADPAEIERFYDAYRRKNPERSRFSRADDAERLVLHLRPEFCRADWFAGYEPVVLYENELALM